MNIVLSFKKKEKKVIEKPDSQKYESSLRDPTEKAKVNIILEKEWEVDF